MCLGGRKMQLNTGEASLQDMPSASWGGAVMTALWGYTVVSLLGTEPQGGLGLW